MYKMLAVVFNDEKSAHESARALADLNRDGCIDVVATEVLQKDTKGFMATRKVEGDFWIQTVAVTATDALIGLLAGRAGAAIGGRIHPWPERPRGGLAHPHPQTYSAHFISH